MKSIDRIFLENKAWAQERLEHDPEFFNRSAEEQSPEFLWIGCSDSRVHSDEITNTEPGEMFVHRNIANLVITTDINMLTVLQYAVDILKVNHVIVCGHYGCGGVKAAMARPRPNLIMVNKWLKHIKEVYRIHEKQLLSIPNEEERLARLVELNVIEQVHNLAHTSIVQHNWKVRRAPELHGWVYDLRDGILRTVIHMDADYRLHPIYQYDLPDES